MRCEIVKNYEKILNDYNIAEAYKAIIYNIITDNFIVDLKSEVGNDVVDEYVQTIFYTWNDNLDVSISHFSGAVLQVIERADEDLDLTDVENIVGIALNDMI